MHVQHLELYYVQYAAHVRINMLTAGLASPLFMLHGSLQSLSSSYRNDGSCTPYDMLYALAVLAKLSYMKLFN